MAAIPVRATLNAAWRDVWNNKTAAVRAGWPLLSTYLAFVALRDSRAAQNVWAWGLIVLALNFCATALNAGAWVRFVARGESRWHLRGRSFVPVALMLLKLLLLLFVAVVVIDLLSRVLFSRVLYLLAVEGNAGAVMCLVVWLGFIAIPNAAVAGKPDLWDAFIIARNHVQELSRFFLIFVLVVLVAILLLREIEILVGLFAAMLDFRTHSAADQRLIGDLVSGLLVLPIYIASIEWGLSVSARAYLVIRPQPTAAEIAELEGLTQRRLQSLSSGTNSNPPVS